MDLFNLLKKTNIYFDKDKLVNHLVHNIRYNSKDSGINDVFVPIKGTVVDGHMYIDEAIKNGCKTVFYEDAYYDLQAIDGVNLIRVIDTKKALALLCSVFFDYPSQKLNMIGITGTNGKTTISTLIYHILKKMDQKSTLIGTNGMYILDKFHETHNTTPNTYVIHDVLKQSVDCGVKHTVIEVSSHAVKEQRIAQLQFDTVIYTNFSLDHLDYHKTFDDYFYNKVLIFAYLGNSYNGNAAIINGDDDYSKQFLNFINVRHVTYGLNTYNDYRARHVICHLDLIQFDFYYRNDFVATIHTKQLFGFFNVYNLLAVLSYFHHNGYNIKEIQEHLDHLPKVKGRFQKVASDYPLEVFVDYAHTPKSVYKILKEVKMITNKNIIVVIGCGGDRDKSKRPMIGKIVSGNAHYAVFTDDNPRNEDSQAILNDILKGVINQNYIMIENREKAIKHAIYHAGETDIVLILGKGHEEYQLINGKKHYFNDYKEALKYLNMRYMEEMYGK